MAAGVERLAPRLWRVRARDGRPYLLRPIRPEDAPALQRAFDRQAPVDRRMRLLADMPRLPDLAARRLCTCVEGRDVCLVLVDPDAPDELLGGARLMRDGEGADRAEFATTMATGMKGQGLGRRTLETTFEFGREIGIRRVWGLISRGNAAMRGLALALGMRERPDPDDPMLVIAELDLAARGATASSPGCPP